VQLNKGADKAEVGALALSAETIIGALTPVFALEYAGINPKILDTLELSNLGPPGEVNLNPLEILAALGGPPLWKISLLATLPLLTNGISSYFLVPLSISIGRRPVMLACGILAWTGGFWAGLSQSLNVHIAARCVQAIGAGAVEALIPLIVQDLVFIHQRNRAMSAIWAAQGLIIVSIGIASPVIVVTNGLGWRFVYFLTSSFAVLAWLVLCAFLPETRWTRSPEELAGKPVYHLHADEARPRIDADAYGPRSIWTDIGFFQNGIENKAAAKSMLDTVRTMLFPSVLWVVMVNSAFISVQNAAGQTGSSVLIAAGWKFRNLGLAVVPIVIATPFVALLGGYVADKVSNAVARRNGGRREPEGHLLNVIFPLVCGVVGCLLFGFAAQNIKTQHWSVLLFAIFLISLGFLTVNTVLSVFIVESYPQWAG
jgi:MFS family permease